MASQDNMAGYQPYTDPKSGQVLKCAPIRDGEFWGVSPEKWNSWIDSVNSDALSPLEKGPFRVLISTAHIAGLIMETSQGSEVDKGCTECTLKGRKCKVMADGSRENCAGCIMFRRKKGSCNHTKASKASRRHRSDAFGQTNAPDMSSHCDTDVEVTNDDSPAAKSNANRATAKNTTESTIDNILRRVSETDPSAAGKTASSGSRGNTVDGKALQHMARQALNTTRQPRTRIEQQNLSNKHRTSASERLHGQKRKFLEHLSEPSSNTEDVDDRSQSEKRRGHIDTPTQESKSTGYSNDSDDLGVRISIEQHDPLRSYMNLHQPAFDDSNARPFAPFARRRSVNQPRDTSEHLDDIDDDHPIPASTPNIPALPPKPVGQVPVEQVGVYLKYVTELSTQYPQLEQKNKELEARNAELQRQVAEWQEKSKRWEGDRARLEMDNEALTAFSNNLIKNEEAAEKLLHAGRALKGPLSELLAVVAEEEEDMDEAE